MSEGLPRGCGFTKRRAEGGWVGSVQICTIANVIAIDAFVVAKGVCAGRVSCVASSPPIFCMHTA